MQSPRQADYSIECYDERYRYWSGPIGIISIVYVTGVPAFFAWLVYRFARHGREGDNRVQSAIGFLYEPFRLGKEWWMPVKIMQRIFLD